MKWKTEWGVVIVCTCLSIPNLAFGASLIAKLTLGEFDPNSKKERVEIATELAAIFDLLDALVPTLKPSEEEWLQREQEAIHFIKDLEASNARAFRWAASAEYQQRELKNLLKNIKEALNGITSQKVPLRQEMVCWAAVVFHLMDPSEFNEPINSLIRAKKLRMSTGIMNKLHMTLDAGKCNHPYASYAWGIQRQIVIRYLQGELQDR